MKILNIRRKSTVVETIAQSQVYEPLKTINLFALGKGVVGSRLLDQILDTPPEVEERRNLRIKIIGVADSQRFVFDPEGIGKNWRQRLHLSNEINNLERITELIQNSLLGNVIVADNTSSNEVAGYYPSFLRSGFDIAASNKKANSGSYRSYSEIRRIIGQEGRLFNYETNVGAGLPIIDTIKYLYNSAEKITRIKGVFSGSLSYIFNNYSVRKDPFSEILLDARDKGLTEPDPREDLSGEDVARKLIILARELGLKPELEDVHLDCLIPRELNDIEDLNSFILKRDVLDCKFEKDRSELSQNEVLRYVAELDVRSEKLSVSLQKVLKESPLGGINNADALFEIYTESYGDRPFVIQGAGAGGAVTARGVYSDLVKMGSTY